MADIPAAVFPASSLEGTWRSIVELYERFSADGWGTLYWGVIWVCAFVITFLLVRMLFTRWGDRNITAKTLGVSLLVHLLAGMISNSVVFGTAGGVRSEEKPGVPIRRVVVEGVRAPGDAADGGADDPFERQRKLPGKSPAWEQASLPESRPISRQPVRTRETPAAELAPDPREMTAQPVAIPAPDVAERPQALQPVPEAMRDVAKIARPAEIVQPRIGEETAQARPETTVRSGAGSRTARAASDALSATTDRGPRTRTTNPQDVRISADGPPTTSPSAGASDPQVPAGRKADARTAPRIGGGPKSTPIGDADSESTAGSGGAPAPAARPFARTGRPGRGPADADATGSGSGRMGISAIPGDSGPAERGSDAAGTGTGLGAPPAGPRVSGGDSPAGIASPSVVRSGGDGVIDKHSSRVPATYRLRTSPQRTKIAIDMGANEESEQAVEASLKWLAANQRPQGYWEPIESILGREPERLNFGEAGAVAREQQTERERSGFQSDAGLTALAVLAFLGKGYTHEGNDFSDNVDRALRWLIAQQDSQGFLGGKANRYARMYCHGMATIALGEAYGMTKDRTLREPLARAIQYIVASQYPDGSWRYSDWRLLETHHRKGDMSMFGWQLMALKSAKTAGLDVPGTAFDKGVDFLIACGNDTKARGQSQAGGLAAYRLGEAPKPAMTAEALFCKQMLGIKRTNKASVEAVDYLMRNLPQRSKQDLYFWYYGTLAMYHQGGEPWRRWNQALRDNLVADQRTDGDFAGSWNPRFPWGDYGGRVFSTAVSALCLEVYYRFLPLYQTEEADKLDQGSEK